MQLEINGKDITVSDGYHTFDELYDHRCLLWINLCLAYSEHCLLVEDHLPGWFLLVMNDPNVGQMSYHCPNEYLKFIENKVKTDDGSYQFDGHKSSDVVKRLMKIAECS